MAMTLSEVILDGLTEKVKHDLQILAIQGWPNEVCGVLHRHHIIHQYSNTFSGDHKLGFDMDIHSTIDVVAIWHSHPGGLPNPSTDDMQCMHELALKGYIYPWIIITRMSVTAWELAFQTQ